MAMSLERFPVGVLPSSKDIAGVNMRLTAGSYREMHWHTADEWAYVLYGNARVTVMNPDGKLDLTKQDSMMVAYTLLKEAGGWRATQTDLHNVEKMDLPYSSAEQKS